MALDGSLVLLVVIIAFIIVILRIRILRQRGHKKMSVGRHDREGDGVVCRALEIHPSFRDMGDAVYVRLNIQGGLTPYSYEWSSGETTPSVLANYGETLEVLVRDLNQCQTSRKIYVPNF